MLQRPLILSRDSKTGGVLASPVAQVKKLSAVQEMWVPSLGQEDPLEKEMPTHHTVLPWEIPWPEETGGQQSMGSQRARHNLDTRPPSPAFLKVEKRGGKTVLYAAYKVHTK